MQKITPFLWFDNNAEEAANFYLSVFKDASITATTRYTKAGPGPEGSVMTIAFTLQGQAFAAINGGPHFKFTEAISLAINCKDQQEVNYYWQALTNGGKESQCGWLKDKYGLSWQVVPTEFLELVKSPEADKVGNMLQAMYGMKKLDIAALKAAYNK